MANVNRIVKFELEDQVVDGLREGKTHPAILEDCNHELALRHADSRGKPPTVSKSSLERYLATVDKEKVPALHQPQNAKKVAGLAFNWSEQFGRQLGIVEKWIGEADTAQVQLPDGNGGVIDGGPDWHARKVASSELRQLTKMGGDMLERVFNAQRIQMFQQSVMEVVADVDPDVARKIEERFKQEAATRGAALLGIAA